MSINTLFSATSIAGSGLAAERLRMEVAANNIANANSTRTLNGGAYRRQHVVFSSAVDEALLRAGPEGRHAGKHLQGVNIVDVVHDVSPLPRVFSPGHPDSDDEGYLEMPNVTLPNEMIDLMTASRAYEANLKSLQTFRQMAEQALSLMRSTG